MPQELPVNCESSDFVSLATEILDRGETLRFTPLGTSMHPFIRSCDPVRIVSVKNSLPRYADVVFFKDRDRGLRLHRIIGTRGHDGGKAFLVKGDSLCERDGLIEAEAVIGKVVTIEKGRTPINIETGFFRRLNVLYTRLLPVTRWAYALIERCLKKTC